MWYNEIQTHFLLLPKRPNRVSSMQQKTTGRNMEFILAQAEHVDNKSFKLPVATYYAMQYRT